VTKDSRGAPNAIIRNAVPEIFPIGFIELDQGIYLQKIMYSESDQFSKARTKEFKKINENQIRELKLGIDLSLEQTVQISIFPPFQKNSKKEKPIGQLSKNNWLKIVGNERSSLEYTWAYKKYVYNIFYGEAHRFDETLQKVKPVVFYKQEMNLW